MESASTDVSRMVRVSAITPLECVDGICVSRMVRVSAVTPLECVDGICVHRCLTDGQSVGDNSFGVCRWNLRPLMSHGWSECRR
jgi:hypothetical protein